MLSSDTTIAVDEVFEGAFECSACGYEAPASVRMKARGAARGKTQEAREAAEANAEELAGTLASRTLMFVRCPKCGQRDPKARAYQVQVVLGVLAMGLAGFAIAFLLLMKSRLYVYAGALTPWIAIACGVTWMARTFVVYRRAWHDVDKRVVLGSGK
ncbi:MAG TPA: hypothetical protein VGM39_04705 [Kofleriaceae bacterium]